MTDTKNGALRQTKTHARNTSRAIDYKSINAAALTALTKHLTMWLADGKLVGCEYHARNPHRDDRHLGSFKVNVKTGRWADFATGDRGGDVVSLFAFIFDLPQREAARQLAALLQLNDGRAS